MPLLGPARLAKTFGKRSGYGFFVLLEPFFEQEGVISDRQMEQEWLRGSVAWLFDVFSPIPRQVHKVWVTNVSITEFRALLTDGRFGDTGTQKLAPWMWDVLNGKAAQEEIKVHRYKEAQMDSWKDAQKEAKYAWYKDRSQPFPEIPMPTITLAEAVVHCIPFRDRVERDFYDVFQNKFLQETFESKVRRAAGSSGSSSAG